MPFFGPSREGTKPIPRPERGSFEVQRVFCRVSLPRRPPDQVTASERAVKKDGASTMDSASPRGSKRGVEEVKPGGKAMGAGERPTAAPERDGRAEEGAEGDVAAGRGDLELCKRNEVRAQQQRYSIATYRTAIYT